ncbi:MAG: F0F1 ATP synthase subunit delta [Paludibacteraceae bacterium]|nr:F0F1 ATP synthase subunit delta [Paludibacteraceae bacterium]
MNSGKISIRYAKALLGFGEKNGEADKVYQEMQLVNAAFEAAPLLQEILETPGLSQQEKTDLLKAILGDRKASKSTTAFFNFVVEQRREQSMHMIALMYEKLYREAHNLLKGELKTAVELPKATIQKIENFVNKRYGATVELTTKTDQSLIGGFVLDVNDERLDASIVGQLSKLNSYAGH